MARAKEIQLIEEEMIQEGKKIEEDDLTVEIEEDTMEIELIREFNSLFKLINLV